MFKNFEGSNFVVWIRIKTDPHVQMRGFSILNRELRVTGFEPVDDEMIDLRGQKMRGRFWVVPEKEVMRVIPELRGHWTGKAWFFPFEFCESFVRPYDYLDYPEKKVDLIWEV